MCRRVHSMYKRNGRGYHMELDECKLEWVSILDQTHHQSAQNSRLRSLFDYSRVYAERQCQNIRDVRRPLRCISFRQGLHTNTD